MENLKKFGKWMNGTTFHFISNDDEPGTFPEELRNYSHKVKKIKTEYGTLLTIPEWLKEFDNLTDLDLKAYAINNLSALSQIKNLKSLSLNTYSTYEELANFSIELTSLKIENINTKDISFISNLKNLHNLSLEECSTNIEFINDLHKLTELRIHIQSPEISLPDLSTLEHLLSLELNNSNQKKYSAPNLNEFNQKAAKIISKCHKLIHLSLHSNIASHVEFETLKKLWDLRFISGALEYIPSEVMNIKRLLSIIIDSCGLKEIPNDINKLENLERLIITNCEIYEIPSAILKLSQLNEIDFSKNNISFIPIEMAKMPNLQEFKYEDNQLTKECIFFNNSLLGVFKQLKQIERDEINIGIIQIPEALRSAVQEYLVYFDEYYEEISGNKIGFKVSKHKDGLKIEVELTNDIDISKVQQALAKYTQYLLDKRFDVENDIDVDKLVKDLQILKLTLETKSNHFDQQMKILELRHQITNDENIFLRQIVTQFAGKENVFVINQKTSNQNHSRLLNTNNITVNNSIPVNEFREIAEILKTILGNNQEIETAIDELENSTETGQRSLIGSALSKVAGIITNTIDKAHIFLVDAPEVVEKLKTALSMAQTVAAKGHYTEIAKMLNTIIHMF